MFSKIIFALAMVCFIHASLVTASDDEPEIEVASNTKSCDLQSCERLCRRLKFPGGACVNGRCKCDNFLNAEVTGVLETEDERTLKRCTDRSCDWVCRRLNHTSGSCVDGRCKCENSVEAKEKPTDLEDLISLIEVDTEIEVASVAKSCDLQSCERLCRRLKFPGGACVNGRCKCDNFLNAEVVADLDTEFEASSNGCKDKACGWVCRILNKSSGSCVDGRCKCEKSPDAKENPTDLEDSVSLTETVTESNVGDSFPMRACNNKKCDQLCRKKKFRGGACLGPNCYINKFLSVHDDEVSEESLPVSELSEDPTKRRCDSRACHQLCRRLKLPGGVCVNGRCKCDNFFTTEDTVDEYSELTTRRGCNLRKCNLTCARRGYAGARCVNGWCNCYDKIQSEDESVLNDDANDENEESNDALINEDMLTAPVQSACNTVNCNQMCHRLNYAGGWCRSGQCQCY